MLKITCPVTKTKKKNALIRVAACPADYIGAYGEHSSRKYTGKRYYVQNLTSAAVD